ncbi:peptidase inhibitor family I36 protein [Saccharomonospora saliphila]|uniref:peptidase inhibitor family I36 protein n=1 Tax=Saccharomonospora saliphila TaxID=369829 RepID=UPI000366D507|nr:peptidase inhibitor family I36 protein [Saccharomonospora saliphila]
MRRTTTVVRSHHQHTARAHTGHPLGSRRPIALGLAALASVLVSVAAGGSPAAAAPDAASPDGGAECQRGEFCLWSEEDYNGDILRLDLRSTNPEACVALSGGMRAHAFANRIDRHVTVYQDQHCATEGDFSTYPGPGTFVPRSPYVVRAIKIWN